MSLGFMSRDAADGDRFLPEITEEYLKILCECAEGMKRDMCRILGYDTESRIASNRPFRLMIEYET